MIECKYYVVSSETDLKVLDELYSPYIDPHLKYFSSVNMPVLKEEYETGLLPIEQVSKGVSSFLKEKYDVGLLPVQQVAKGIPTVLKVYIDGREIVKRWQGTVAKLQKTEIGMKIIAAAVKPQLNHQRKD